MRLFVCFLATSLFYTLHAQQTGAYDDGSNSYFPNEVFSLSVSPLALVDIYNGSAYKAGISFRPVSRMRITADAGGYVPSITEAISDFNEMRGYHFRASIGIPSGHTKHGFGYGLAYQYKKQEFSFQNRTLSIPQDYTAFVNKYAHSYNAYISGDLHFGWRWYLELRLEAGIRYREINNSQNDLIEDTEDWNNSLFNGRIINTKGILPNVSVSVRMNFTPWLD